MVIGLQTVAGEMHLNTREAESGWHGTFTPDRATDAIRDSRGERVIVDLGEGRRTVAEVQTVGPYYTLTLFSLDTAPFW